MTIKTLSFEACMRLIKFCELANIRYTSELLDDGLELRFYDFWIEDKFLNLNVKPATVYFYTKEYDCMIHRDEFQEIQII